LFVQIELKAKLEVLRTPGVVRLVGTSRAPVEIPTADIANLQRAMQCKGEIAPHDYLNVGDKVRLIRGPFAAMSGVLTRRENQLRVIVALDSIQRAFCVNVDIRDVESSSPVARGLIGSNFDQAYH